MWARAFIVVSLERNWRGRVKKLSEFEYFQQALVCRGCPSRLVPDPGRFRHLDSAPVQESLTKEAVRDLGSGLAGLHMKGVLSGQSFTVSRNRLALEGGVSSGSARPQDL